MLEKAVKDGSHTEYHKLLSDIEQKRTKMLYVAEMRRSLAEGNVSNFFNSQKNAAYSQYYASDSHILKQRNTWRIYIHFFFCTSGINLHFEDR